MNERDRACGRHVLATCQRPPDGEFPVTATLRSPLPSPPGSMATVSYLAPETSAPTPSRDTNDTLAFAQSNGQEKSAGNSCDANTLGRYTIRYPG